MVKIMSLFSVLSLLCATASADAVRVRVGKLNAKLSVESDLKIQSVSLQLDNQFCNFFGTTCAGGPRDSKSVEGTIGEDSSLKTPAIRLRSTKIGHRFSSCRLALVVNAVDSSGKELQATGSIAHINDKSLCEDEKQLTAEAREKLDKGVTVKLNVRGFYPMSVVFGDGN